MPDLLTTKQVARAIQVSESSIKRWCDKGVIETHYTAGGHRRIHLSGLLEFLRTNQYRLVRPEVLGLPASTGQTAWVVERARNELGNALIAGELEKSRRIVLDLFLAEHSLAKVCDEVIAPAFADIGEKWECGDAEVYQERRGCEITLRLLYEMRSLIPSAKDGAPLALGGAGADDQYNLATTMAELVLTDAGWNAASLGDNLPFRTLAAAIRERKPKLFWLSCSHVRDADAFLAGYNSLFDEFGADVAFVVGGRALVEPVRREMKYAAYCDNMRHLESFAQTLIRQTARSD